MNKLAFQELVRQKGRELYRDMPWRHTDDPYLIMVSEVMLQQTQVDRVVGKYNEFIACWPTVFSLSQAPLADVVSAWNGLGYNRRAKYLHSSAAIIVSEHGAQMPNTLKGLQALPGIGSNTAAAIMAYAFNCPVGFVETNIRTVYFSHYFDTMASVTDAQLRQVVDETVDLEHPREWFWALMDYGSYLKKQGFGHIDKSAHYKKQPPLKGSKREVRGQIIRELSTSDMLYSELRAKIMGDDRYEPSLNALIKEGMVSRTKNRLHLTK